MTSPRFDPTEAGFYENPYVQYESLRRSGAVHQVSPGIYFLPRWRTVHELLDHPGLGVADHSAPAIARLRSLAKGVGRLDVVPFETSLYSIDPPRHAQVRETMAAAVTALPRALMSARIHQVLSQLLAELAERGEADLMEDFANPYPFALICEAMGLPPSADLVRVRILSATLADVLDPVLAVLRAEAIRRAWEDMLEYMAGAVEWRLSKGDESGQNHDIITTVLARQDRAALSRRELLENLSFLLIAGHETTASLIGNSLLGLLRHPAEMASLADGNGIGIGKATDELLRFDCPIQVAKRVANVPIAVDERVLEAGSFLMLGLGSANHDPDRFGADADNLQLARTSASHHLAFGGGAHRCLGSRLARLQASRGIGALVRQFPKMQLVAEQPAWKERFVLRGPDCLRVRLSPTG